MRKSKYGLLIGILLLMGCTKNEQVYIDQSNDYLKLKVKELEVYSDNYLLDLVDIVNKDIEIISNNELIDTTKLGKVNIDIKYKYNKKIYNYKQEIEIKDTTAPLVFSGTNKTINLNYEKDLCDLIIYGDNYSQEVKCNIDGYYDLQKEGTYKLVYSLKDSSNNEKKVNVILNVKVPTSQEGSSSKGEIIEFKDIYNEYKNDHNEIGIDVSKWQGNIDFQKVKEDGASFVMIRIAHQNKTKEELKLDEYFKENLRKAKEANLKVGIYLYSIATSKEEAIKQADFVINSLEKESLELPIVFDWESWNNWNSYHMSFYDINEVANSFMKRINDAGYKGMLYSSKFYLEKIWTNKLDFPVWLAHYTKKTNYEGKYVMWQMANNGHINGINGNVDIDIMYEKKEGI